MILTASCTEPRVEVRTVVPEVAAPLRTPCLVEPRPYETLSDVALILTDYVESLDCANGKIVTIDRILKDAASKE